MLSIPTFERFVSQLKIYIPRVSLVGIIVDYENKIVYSEITRIN